MDGKLTTPVVIVLDNACTQDSIAVLWEKVEGAVGYEVFIEDEFAALTESTDYTFEGLEADGEYEVYVCAVDEDGSRIRSEAVIMHTRKAARVYNIMDYGAKACEVDNPIMTDTDRMPDCTDAIQQAINECGDGDMVYVEKDAELTIGDVGIFCVDGAMYCKQYYLDDNNNLVLVSANPELRHTNIFVSADSGRSVKACGKVLLKEKIDLPDYLFED